MNGQPRSHRQPRDDEAARGRRRDLVWSVFFFAASVIGGLAAGKLTREAVWPAVGYSVIVATLATAVLTAGLLDDDNPADSRPPAQQGHRRQNVAGGAPATGTSQAGAQASGQAETQPPGPPRLVPGTANAGPEPLLASAEPVHVRLVRPRDAGGAWWQASGSPAKAGAPGHPAGEAGIRQADLSGLADRAQIAQCPNCGSFSVDVDNRAAEWLFSCQECYRQWRWRPGTPWPPVNVRPDARRDRARPPQ